MVFNKQQSAAGAVPVHRRRDPDQTARRHPRPGDTGAYPGGSPLPDTARTAAQHPGRTRPVSSMIGVLPPEAAPQ